MADIVMSPQLTRNSQLFALLDEFPAMIWICRTDGDCNHLNSAWLSFTGRGIDEAEYKPADINAGIESTINIVWNELKYKVNLIREYGDIPETKCNPGQLNQVFMNILVNAAQAIEAQGDILVKTWSENGLIYILISDNGSGMSQETLKRIFEPFFTTKDVGKGTGLGLSIAYDIIKKHNGEIRAESVIGKGTSFTIVIPVVEA
jgi:two-component system NtrC family sensor kinase